MATPRVTWSRCNLSQLMGQLLPKVMKVFPKNTTWRSAPRRVEGCVEEYGQVPRMVATCSFLEFHPQTSAKSQQKHCDVFRPVPCLSSPSHHCSEHTGQERVSGPTDTGLTGTVNYSDPGSRHCGCTGEPVCANISHSSMEKEIGKGSSLYGKQ